MSGPIVRQQVRPRRLDAGYSTTVDHNRRRAGVGPKLLTSLIVEGRLRYVVDLPVSKPALGDAVGYPPETSSIALTR
jgi:hypothetical protein